MTDVNVTEKEECVDIYLIWATDGDAIWLVGAWDGDSVAENATGYREDVECHRNAHGHDNVRVVRASIDFDAVARAFQTPSIGAAEVLT